MPHLLPLTCPVLADFEGDILVGAAAVSVFFGRCRFSAKRKKRSMPNFRFPETGAKYFAPMHFCADIEFSPKNKSAFFLPKNADHIFGQIVKKHYFSKMVLFQSQYLKNRHVCSFRLGLSTTTIYSNNKFT